MTDWKNTIDTLPTWPPKPPLTAAEEWREGSMDHDETSLDPAPAGWSWGWYAPMLGGPYVSQLCHRAEPGAEPSRLRRRDPLTGQESGYIFHTPGREAWEAVAADDWAGALEAADLLLAAPKGGRS